MSLPKFRLLIQPHNDEVFNMYNKHPGRSPGDAGIDLYCVEDQLVNAGSTSIKIGLGISCQMSFPKPAGVKIDNGVSYLLVPRSSMGSKTPLRIANSIGVIDSTYRGEICGIVDNHSGSDYQIKKGDRLFQIVHPSLLEVNMQVVTKLSGTGRGGGFGSTGR